MGRVPVLIPPAACHSDSLAPAFRCPAIAPRKHEIAVPIATASATGGRDGEDNGIVMRSPKAPGRTGPIKRNPWTDGAFPHDWRGARGKFSRKSPRPGARTGPVRGRRR